MEVYLGRETGYTQHTAKNMKRASCDIQQVLLRHSGDLTHNLDREWHSNLPVRVSQSSGTSRQEIKPIEILDSDSDGEDGNLPSATTFPTSSSPPDLYVCNEAVSLFRPLSVCMATPVLLCRPTAWESLETMKQRIVRGKQARADLEFHRASKMTDSSSGSQTAKPRTDTHNDLLNAYNREGPPEESQTWLRANFPSDIAVSSSRLATEARTRNSDAELEDEKPSSPGGSRTHTSRADRSSGAEVRSAPSLTAGSEKGPSAGAPATAPKVRPRPRALSHSASVPSSKAGPSVAASAAAQKVRPRALGDSSAVSSSKDRPSADAPARKVRVLGDGGTAPSAKVAPSAVVPVQKVRPQAVGDGRSAERTNLHQTGSVKAAVKATPSVLTSIAPRRSTDQLGSRRPSLLQPISRSPTFLTKAPSWSAFQATADERRSTAVETPAQQKRRSIQLASPNLGDSDR